MTDKTDVIAEAKVLVEEASNLPMSTVLNDYVKYLKDHPDVFKNADLSQTMTSNMASILPDLIVEDIRETAQDGSGSLLPTETLAELQSQALQDGTHGTPYSALANIILQDTAFLKQAGVVSADGQTFNLDNLTTESTDGSHFLTSHQHSGSEEFLADGTVLWRDPGNNIVAAQYQNGMIVQLTGNDTKPITNKDDLASSSYVPTQIIYPNGSSVLRVPDLATSADNGWFFSDANSGITYQTTALNWNSPYFQSLQNNYVIPFAVEQNTSSQATFSSDGSLLIFSRTVFNDDNSINQAQSVTVDSVNKVLKLADEPTYKNENGQWLVQSDDGKWNNANVAPSISSQNGFLDVVLPPDAGSKERGNQDLYPGGRHLAYYPDGAAYDLNNQRVFAGNVQVYNLLGATSNLNMPGQIMLPERSVVVLPDHSTIQTDDHNQWTHYAYAANPQDPLAKGAALGLVTQPLIDGAASPNSQMYFQSDSGDLVPFSIDTKTRTYNLQVNGSLETFSFGGDLSLVKRRDGSVIEFSTTKPIHPVKISFQGVDHPPNVNVSDIVYDYTTNKWSRAVTQNGKAVQSEVEVELNQNSNFDELKITNADGSQDIFHGGTPAEHIDAQKLDAQNSPAPTATAASASNIKLHGDNVIEVSGAVPVSLTLDDSELSTIGFTPMLTPNGGTIKIAIPADKIAQWKSNAGANGFSFPYVLNNNTYTITVSSDLKTVNVVLNLPGGASGESETFSAQGVQQNTGG